jgi:hypothetical protein
MASMAWAGICPCAGQAESGHACCAAICPQCPSHHATEQVPQQQGGCVYCAQQVQRACICVLGDGPAEGCTQSMEGGCEGRRCSCVCIICATPAGMRAACPHTCSAAVYDMRMGAYERLGLSCPACCPRKRAMRYHFCEGPNMCSACAAPVQPVCVLQGAE